MKEEQITDEQVPKELGPDFMCGFRSWRPNGLQRFTNIHWFLPFISIFSLIQGNKIRRKIFSFNLFLLLKYSFVIFQNS